MHVQLSRHALDQMSARIISEEMIDAALTNPVRMPATTRGTRYDGFVADGRMLTVVIDDRREPAVVITVWWTVEGR